MYGGTEEGIKNFTRMLEGRRSFVISRPRWKDGHKEIGCGDVGGGDGLGSSGSGCGLLAGFVNTVTNLWV